MVQQLSFEIENFHNISQNQCAIIDITSLHILVRTNNDLLTVKIDDSLYAYINYNWGKHELAFELLSRLVCFDFVVVDAIGLELVPSLGYSDEQGGLSELKKHVRKTIIPPEIYYEASKNIENYWSQDNTWSNDNKWFDGHYKNYLDELWAFLPLDKRPSPLIVDSNNSGPRIIFYLELARLSGVPIFLNKGKDSFFEEYKKQMPQDALRKINAILKKHMSKLEKELFLESLNIPPLPEYILREARRQNITVLEAVSYIKETKEAKKFREWIGQLQFLLCSSDYPNYLEAAKVLDELNKSVEVWFDLYNVNFGTTRTKTKLNLEAIPVIGWIFKFADKGEIELQDPMLKRPLYLSFIAKWLK